MTTAVFHRMPSASRSNIGDTITILYFLANCKNAFSLVARSLCVLMCSPASGILYSVQFRRLRRNRSTDAIVACTDQMAYLIRKHRAYKIQPLVSTMCEVYLLHASAKQTTFTLDAAAASRNFSIFSNIADRCASTGASVCRTIECWIAPIYTHMKSIIRICLLIVNTQNTILTRTTLGGLSSSGRASNLNARTSNAFSLQIRFVSADTSISLLRRCTSDSR